MTRATVNLENPGHVRILRADQRGCVQNLRYRSLRTFDDSPDQAEGRHGFSMLQALNDETLAPGATATYWTKNNGLIVVIPLVGTCVCTFPSGVYTAEPGQVLTDTMAHGDRLTFQNTFADEHVNYLVLEFQDEKPLSAGLSEVHIEQPYNTLHRVAVSPRSHLLLGGFQGRWEVALTFGKPKKIFVFVLEGAFEVNKRLLQRRDGLTLEECSTLDFEALSNHALLMAVEFF